MRPSPIAPRLIVTLLAAALLAPICGCPAPGGNNNNGPAKLKHFASADELVKYVRAQVKASRTTRFGLPGAFDAAEDLGGTPAPTAGGDDAANGGGEAPAVDFTGTNIQEAGVDESDYFKFDGEYLYLGRGQTVRIVHAFPADSLEEVAQIDLGEQVTDLYLSDSRLIVLSRGGDALYAPAVDIAIWPPYYVSAKFTVTAIDVSDPTDPQVQESAEFDGTPVSTRLTDGKLIVVMTVQPDLPTDLLAISQIGLSDILPMRTTAEGSEPAVPWQDVYRPDEENGYLMTAVLTLDASDVTNTLGSSAIVAGAGTIYASPEALYVTDTTYDVNDDQREETDIHKFAFNGEGVAEYAGSGSVPGRPLNQFSLGEKDGYLRIATHVENFNFFGGDVAVSSGGGTVAVGVDEPPPADDGAGSAGSDGSAGSSEPSAGTAQATDVTQPYNAVYVLGPSEDGLSIVGQLENIAPGETLYSARFIGDRGFLVTFQRIDPLFTVDLSQPSKPRLRGELKVPGFSDYLHPFGDNYLIGVGRSTETAPWGGTIAAGVQLSLFDVSDLDNPKAIQQLKIGGSGSMADASYDHKAFAFLASQGVLALPATIYPDDFDWNDWTDDKSAPDIFSGVAAYHVDATDGFQEIGRLETLNPADYGYFYGGWRRALVADGVLYALTDNGVRAAPMDQLDASVELPLED